MKAPSRTVRKALERREHLLPATPPNGLNVTRLGPHADGLVVLSHPLEVPRLPGVLSPAEREVAELALLGMTNAQIAQRRGCSPRTVANHLARVFRKLSVGSRAALAAKCAELEHGK